MDPDSGRKGGNWASGAFNQDFPQRSAASYRPSSRQDYQNSSPRIVSQWLSDNILFGPVDPTPAPPDNVLDDWPTTNPQSDPPPHDDRMNDIPRARDTNYDPTRDFRARGHPYPRSGTGDENHDSNTHNHGNFSQTYNGSRVYKNRKVDGASHSNAVVHVHIHENGRKLLMYDHKARFIAKFFRSRIILTRQYLFYIDFTS
ncbi:hypothetical protein V5O48_008465 [Marasmius crinis-equi]|uniref:Uncharacterized protein n=1 Tax=Marasmius crinis-equi TaxID=585013 RepID=A0ABR3FE54_9AGAR